MYTHVYIGNGRLRIESFTSTKSSVKTYVSFANSPNPFPIAITKKTKTGVFTSRALKACCLLQSMPKSGNSYWCSSAISLTPQLIKSVSFADNCCKRNRSAGR